ncbi:Oidioi.mRNA.OKI2018_I69.XSR.g14536.t1.cds [Oikopleura dioica]|uniref:Oidioi.mRNA.OKI2018_I69.XSR.g14536.t1.cds n=1 Tax=Oikopleura dioica TaxID=34765 RepID=A0ABN7SE36_OIKDI|nr:Oidioi.mRNA.OKI2018_I69.XSR.g14536.t1.cds [Oikopleura dioica]
MKRHDVYLAALAQRNRLRREAEEKSIEQQRKIDRERGFSAYVNGANTRAKSATGPRTQSRVSTASSSKSPEPKKPMTALGTSRATRKSWAESMVQDKGPFFDKDDDSEEEEGIMYSETFDDDEHTGKFEASSSSTPEMQKSSSIESVEERVHTPSSSRELVVPQLSACTSRSGRRGWTLDSSIPFATLKVASQEFSDGSKSSLETASTASSPSPELGGSVSTGDALRAKEQRRNILQESWNLIDNFERKNKGRSSLIFSESFSENNPTIEEEREELYSDFIPVTPSGQILDLIIHSTWGDQNYAGLNGLEVWNTQGEIVKVSSITSHDFRESVLDPRSKLQNIINGNYNTSDDLHTWLAELPKTRKPRVTLEFKRVQSIAMIRVWNYNRNRVHARRGVKHLELRLDQKVIFSNEIVCGQGDKSTPALEPIIFTTEEEVFNRIAQNDPVFPK